MARPVVAAVNPRSGSTAGGDTVTITGSGFTGADRVVFGTTRVMAFTVDSDSRITVTAPPHAAGTIKVRVHPAAGISVKNPGARYTYR